MDSNNFPVEGIVPKESTQVQEFLRANERLDGRSVKIAVLDTGIDPGAAGLQQTTTGMAKIADLIDCTSDGDVDCTTVLSGEVSGDCIRLTLGDRGLLLPISWKSRENEYNIGYKSAYDVFPKSLVERMKTEYRKFLEKSHRDIVSKIEEGCEHQSSIHEKDIHDRLDHLGAALDGFEDFGPTYDCITFHDGKKWCGAVDVTGTGDFRQKAKLLSDYSSCLEYASFGAEQLNFALNVYDNGRRLSIVTDAGPHGTHVASIIAANYPDQPWRNGIAPGAQLIGCKIGDTRLASEETMVALIRAMTIAVENNCDLINLSFGEPITKDNMGRFMKVATEVVEQHKIIFCAAAGNAGPALSTVDAPGGTTHALMAIGAHVTPAMMESMYSMRKAVPSTQYTWSSRGPSIGGDLGVSVSAPGGAIASVPRWTLKRNQLMNGTSMATPYVCGCLGVLISALKAQKIGYSPFSVRRAVEATAAQFDGDDLGMDVWGVGHGLIQIAAAYDTLVRQASAKAELLHFDVSLPSRAPEGSAVARGVYVRNFEEGEQSITETVMVEPCFHEKVPNAERSNFDMLLRLECDAPWVQSPSTLLLSGARSFELGISASDLPAGRAYYSEVVGYDNEAPDAAGSASQRALFRVPITVVRPWPLHLYSSDVSADSMGDGVHYNASRATLALGTFTLPACGIRRWFMTPPTHATHAQLSLRAGDVSGSHILTVHCVSLLHDVAFKDTQFKRDVRVRANLDRTFSFSVIPGHTLEICVAHYWSSISPLELQADIVFHAVVADAGGAQGAGLTTVAGVGGPMMRLDPASCATPISVATPLRPEEIAPKATFTSLQRCLRPTSASIHSANGSRNRIPPNRQAHELHLIYPVEGIGGSVAPVVPSLADLLYDCPFEAQLWSLTDCNCRVLGWGDGLYRYPVQLCAQETYTIKLVLRHEDVKLLEKVRQLPITLEKQLKAEKMSLNIFPSKQSALLGDKKVTTLFLPQGGHVRICIATPLTAALPKDARDGDELVGELCLPTTSSSDKDSGLWGIPICMRVAAKPGGAASAVVNAGSPEDHPVLRSDHHFRNMIMGLPSAGIVVDDLIHEGICRRLEGGAISMSSLESLAVDRVQHVLGVQLAFARTVLPATMIGPVAVSHFNWMSAAERTIRLRIHTLYMHAFAPCLGVSVGEEPADGQHDDEVPVPLVAQSKALRFHGDPQISQGVVILTDAMIEVLRLKACVLGAKARQQRLAEAVETVHVLANEDHTGGSDQDDPGLAEDSVPAVANSGLPKSDDSELERSTLGAVMQELSRWTDIDAMASAVNDVSVKDDSLEDHFIAAYCEWMMSRGLFGAALKVIHRKLTVTPGRAPRRILYEKLLELYEALNWVSWSQVTRRTIRRVFPASPMHSML